MQGGSGGGSWRDFDWRDWGRRTRGSFIGSLKGIGQALAALLLFGAVIILGQPAAVSATALACPIHYFGPLPSESRATSDACCKYC